MKTTTITATYHIDGDLLEKVKIHRPTKENPLLLIIKADLDASGLVMDGMAAMMEAARAEDIEGFSIVVIPQSLSLETMTVEALDALGLQYKPGHVPKGLVGVEIEDTDTGNTDDTCDFCGLENIDIEKAFFLKNGKWMCWECIRQHRKENPDWDGKSEDEIQKLIEELVC